MGGGSLRQHFASVRTAVLGEAAAGKLGGRLERSWACVWVQQAHTVNINTPSIFPLLSFKSLFSPLD